jgi:signal transduction histidine kinase
VPSPFVLAPASLLLLGIAVDIARFPATILLGLLLVGWQLHTSVRLYHHKQELDAVNLALSDLVRSLDHARNEERRRIAADVHDFALQDLVAAAMHLELAARLAGEEPGGDEEVPTTVREVARAGRLLDTAMRALRRTVTGIEPVTLRHGTLADTLRVGGQEMAEVYGYQVDVEVDLPEVLPLATHLVAWRVFNEAMHNVGRHARANHVRVHAHPVDCCIALRIDDDAVGLPRPTDLRDTPPPGNGWGMQLLMEQVRTVGGSTHVSSKPGEGCEIDVVLPAP